MSSRAWHSPYPMPAGLSAPKESIADRVSNAVRRSSAVRGLVSPAFRGLHALGVSATPVHFYFPAANVSRLETGKGISPSERPGVDYDIPGALSRLSRWMSYS